MTPPKSYFVPFLRAVHRRLVLVRALERAGICAAIAAGFALVFTGAMLWRGEDGLALAIGTVVLGGAVGLLWGLARRPAVTDAARAADRQFDLSDLLATALALVASDDPWARAVVAVANQRCRALSPDAVIVAKLGGRAWGGIGLAAGLVITLAALSALPRESVAARSGLAEYPPESSSSSSAQSRDVLSVPVARAPRDDAASGIQSPSSKQAADARVSSSLVQAPPGATTAGDGGGRGETQSRVGGEHPMDLAAAPGANGTGTAVGGMGAASGEASTGAPGGPAGTRAGAPAGRSDPAPWQSPSWEPARQGALRAVQEGHVPAPYREIVQEYFRERER
jgi:hypothetical protein